MRSSNKAIFLTANVSQQTLPKKSKQSLTEEVQLNFNPISAKESKLKDKRMNGEILKSQKNFGKLIYQTDRKRNRPIDLQASI